MSNKILRIYLVFQLYVCVIPSASFGETNLIFFGFQSKTLDSNNRDILKEVVINHLKNIENVAVSSNQQYIPNMINNVKMYGYDICETPSCYSIFAGMFQDVKMIVGFAEDGYTFKFELFNPVSQVVEKRVTKKLEQGIERVNFELKGLLYDLLDGLIEFGRLTVITEPPNCSLFIDGVYLGETPLDDYAIGAGNHKIAIIKSGLPTHNEEVLIENGKKRVVNISIGKEIGKGEMADKSGKKQDGAVKDSKNSTKKGVDIDVSIRLLGEYRYLIPYSDENLAGQSNTIGGLGIGLDINKRWGIRVDSLLNLYTSSEILDPFYEESASALYYFATVGPLSIAANLGYDFYLILPAEERTTNITYFNSGLHAGVEFDLKFQQHLGIFLSPIYYGMLDVDVSNNEGLFNYSGFSLLSGLTFTF